MITISTASQEVLEDGSQDTPRPTEPALATVMGNSLSDDKAPTTVLPLPPFTKIMRRRKRRCSVSNILVNRSATLDFVGSHPTRIHPSAAASRTQWVMESLIFLVPSRGQQQLCVLQALKRHLQNWPTRQLYPYQRDNNHYSESGS